MISMIMHVPDLHAKAGSDQEAMPELDQAAMDALMQKKASPPLVFLREDKEVVKGSFGIDGLQLLGFRVEGCILPKWCCVHGAFLSKSSVGFCGILWCAEGSGVAVYGA